LTEERRASPENLGWTELGVVETWWWKGKGADQDQDDVLLDLAALDDRTVREAWPVLVCAVAPSDR
jgi:hypothetical protein